MVMWEKKTNDLQNQVNCTSYCDKSRICLFTCGTMVNLNGLIGYRINHLIVN